MLTSTLYYFETSYFDRNFTSVYKDKTYEKYHQLF